MQDSHDALNMEEVQHEDLGARTLTRKSSETKNNAYLINLVVIWQKCCIMPGVFSVDSFHGPDGGTTEPSCEDGPPSYGRGGGGRA